MKMKMKLLWKKRSKKEGEKRLISYSEASSASLKTMKSSFFVSVCVYVQVKGATHKIKIKHNMEEKAESNGSEMKKLHTTEIY